jgi:hypothetical protein
MSFREIGLGDVQWIGWAYGLMEEFCEIGNELSCSVEKGEFHDGLSS